MGRVRGPVEPSFERPFFADARRMDRANYLHPSISVGGISVGNYRNDSSKLEVSAPNALMPVYYVAVALTDLPPRHAWQDGRHQRTPEQPTGGITSYDLRQSWETELSFPFHTVGFYLPQTAFDELTDDLGQRRVETLTCTPDALTIDPVAHHLARALDAIIDSPETMPSLLVDHILEAARLHLAVRYGGLRLPEKAPARLSAEQMRTLRELMLDEPWRELRVAELAAACNMPTRTFDRAFKKAFGATPHRWRLAAKLELARRMIELGDKPLVEIAAVCGFCDQSHLTRAFMRRYGVSPGAHRRRHRS